MSTQDAPAPAPVPKRQSGAAAATGLSGAALAVRIVFGVAVAALAVYLPQHFGQTTTKLLAQAILWRLRGWKEFRLARAL